MQHCIITGRVTLALRGILQEASLLEHLLDDIQGQRDLAIFAARVFAETLEQPLPKRTFLQLGPTPEHPSPNRRGEAREK